MKERAFTLLELLVVIAIIAILAGLIFPVSRAAKLRSDQMVSISNLKQWGTGLNNSLGDNNSMLPWDGATDGSGTLTQASTEAWYNRLPKSMNMPTLDEMLTADGSDASKSLPAAGRKSVWINPAVPTSANATFFTPPSKMLFCYAMNAYLNDGLTESGSNAHLLSAQRVQNPSATVFMAEKTGNVPNLTPNSVKAYFGAAVRDNNDLPIEDATKGAKNVANFLFLDGHVASIERSVFTAESATKTDQLDTNFTFVPYEGANPNPTGK